MHVRIPFRCLGFLCLYLSCLCSNHVHPIPVTIPIPVPIPTHTMGHADVKHWNICHVSCPPCSCSFPAMPAQGLLNMQHAMPSLPILFAHVEICFCSIAGCRSLQDTQGLATSLHTALRFACTHACTQQPIVACVFSIQAHPLLYAPPVGCLQANNLSLTLTACHSSDKKQLAEPCGSCCHPSIQQAKKIAAVQAARHVRHPVSHPSSPAAAAQAPATDRLPGYSIGKTIGEGGFCKVRMGVHDLSGQHVAIKVIDKLKLKVGRKAHCMPFEPCSTRLSLPFVLLCQPGTEASLPFTLT